MATLAPNNFSPINTKFQVHWKVCHNSGEALFKILKCIIEEITRRSVNSLLYPIRHMQLRLETLKILN